MGIGSEADPPIILRARGWTGIERLLITNFDEDHISDLPALRRTLPIELLSLNKSISSSQLRTLKRQGGSIAPAMDSLLEMMDSCSTPAADPLPEFPNVEIVTFRNEFGDLNDTNNCSLVTFLRANRTTVLVPGDLEEAGWQELLKELGFRDELSRVDFFVASHHGRESGYCAEVFRYARNVKLFIFSDSEVSYGTQEMANTYREHASGCDWYGYRRRVLSTRRDGTLKRIL